MDRRELNDGKFALEPCEWCDKMQGEEGDGEYFDMYNFKIHNGREIKIFLCKQCLDSSILNEIPNMRGIENKYCVHCSGKITNDNYIIRSGIFNPKDENPVIRISILIYTCSEKCKLDKMKSMRKETETRMICKVCGNCCENMKKCSKCKKTYYCSRECQINDWPEHKKICNEN
jgi:hypothetical protein